MSAGSTLEIEQSFLPQRQLIDDITTKHDSSTFMVQGYLNPEISRKLTPDGRLIIGGSLITIQLTPDELAQLQPRDGKPSPIDDFIRIRYQREKSADGRDEESFYIATKGPRTNGGGTEVERKLQSPQMIASADKLLTNHCQTEIIMKTRFVRGCKINQLDKKLELDCINLEQEKLLHKLEIEHPTRETFFTVDELCAHNLPVTKDITTDFGYSMRQLAQKACKDSSYETKVITTYKQERRDYALCNPSRGISTRLS